MAILPSVVVITLFFCGSHAGSAEPLKYTEFYVDSLIDHFNPLIRNPNTFQQRILLNRQYFDEESGPILVYTGNEGSIDHFWNNTGFVFELAKAFSGYVVFIEHRYYGKSIPFGDAWHQDYNYQFLTVEQAIADYAVFLADLKNTLGNPKRKIIAFGGSYGGMLAAYMRFKYPNVVDGALSAGAPIFPMGKYDFYRAVTEDCERYNAECPVRVRQGYAEVMALAAQVNPGFAELTELFSLCKPLDASSFPHFLLWARNSFTVMAMADYPYPASFLGSLPAWPINDACNTILNGAGPIIGLANATVRFYDATAHGGKAGECHDLDEEYVDCAAATGCDMMAQWDIQICLQVRLASGTNNVTDMFPPTAPWSTTMYTDYCQKKYGSGLAYDPAFFSLDLWSDRISAASNIIFSVGDLDPWRYGAVTGDAVNISGIFPITVKGGAHHLDLRGSDTRDPATVTAAREQEKQIIAGWIKT